MPKLLADSLFNSSRERLYRANAEFARDIPDGAFVLDAGAGAAPYAPLFRHTQYETSDFEKVDKPYGSSTYVCDICDIPVADARFDFIVFNQVMEHLPEPANALAELHRVLKPGGRLIYTAPLFYEEHEQPYDFYRYTRFGARYLFEKSGFLIESLEWLDGYFATIAYQFATMAKYLPTHSDAYGGGLSGTRRALLARAQRRVFGLASRRYHALEMRYFHTASGFPKNYKIIASKPEA